MSKYTTGEIAKLCGVTVRTVQYYDSREILVPSELSEGGRRLYSEDDLKRMKIICFLRDLGLPINSISGILAEENSNNVISLILEQQEQTLKKEIREHQEKLKKLEELKAGLKGVKEFSVESIGDIAHTMKGKKELRKMRIILLLTGLPVSILQWTSIILWIDKGLWWLFVIWAVVAISCGIFVSRWYYKKVSYICPECHTVFKQTFKEIFKARHTATARKLNCPSCGYHGFCVEVIAESDEKNNG